VNLGSSSTFLVIAEGAERLLVAQPSLSQQIGVLEAELGGSLLERMPRGVRLTMAGQNFLPEARAAVGHVDRARRSARIQALCHPLRDDGFKASRSTPTAVIRLAPASARAARWADTLAWGCAVQQPQQCRRRR
jgi:DNA-binding transcriptional LysR family regulator